MFGNWFKKEAPFQGLIGFGGGATSLFVKGGTDEDPLGWDVSGGSEYEVGDYRFHVIRLDTPAPTKNIHFTTAGSPGEVDILVVAGGGGAGGGDNAYGAGGGAGGVIMRPGKPVSPGEGPHTIVIGDGGPGQPVDNSNPGTSRKGENTTIASAPSPFYYIAKGGGGGAMGAGYSFGVCAEPGGSAGGIGGGANGCTVTGSALQPQQPGESGQYGGGHGASSGGGGGSSGSSTDFNGGAGWQWPLLPTDAPNDVVPGEGAGPGPWPGTGGGGGAEIGPTDPSWQYFGGGGSRYPGTGGLGSGSAAPDPADPFGSAPAVPGPLFGAEHRGGGGSSATSNNPESWAGDGGSGIVIFRYKYK